MEIHILLLFCCCLTSTRSLSPEPLLLVISLDGFRYDYHKTATNKSLSHFERLLRSGVSAVVKPIFPALTLPNHMTLVTGLYAENHGVVGDYFFDPEYSAYFDSSIPINMYDSKWFSGTEQTVEPLWVTNERYFDSRSMKRQSGIYSWPTCKSPYQSSTPSDFVVEDELTPVQRMQVVLSWFLREDNPVNFALLHLTDLTRIATKHSPHSGEIIEALASLDEAIGLLFATTDSNDDLRNLLNVVLIGAHGVTSVAPDHHLGIMSYVDLSDFNLYYDIYGQTPVFSIYPQPGQEDEVAEKFSQIPHTQLHRKQDFTESLHYKNNRRVLSLTLLVDAGWSLEQFILNMGNKTHGQLSYNPDIADMHTSLFAMGPAFKSSLTSKMLRMVDIYALLCQLLRMQPNKHDGDINNIKHLLKDTFQLLPNKANYNFAMVGTVLAVMVLLFLIILPFHCHMPQLHWASKSNHSSRHREAVEASHHLLSQSTVDSFE